MLGVKGLWVRGFGGQRLGLGVREFKGEVVEELDVMGLGLGVRG